MKKVFCALGTGKLPCLHYCCKFCPRTVCRWPCQRTGDFKTCRFRIDRIELTWRIIFGTLIPSVLSYE